MRQRNSSFKIKQARIRMEELKVEIRDEICSRIEGVRLAHSMLMKTRQVRTAAGTGLTGAV